MTHASRRQGRSAVRTTGERGLALIVAMLVAALAAAVAISLATAQAQWTAQVAQRRDQVQAQSIALAGIQWTRQILDATRSAPFNHLGEAWALPLPATPVENGSVEGHIVDAQGMLNVNNLADGNQTVLERQRFDRLFNALRVPPATLAAMVDWVDSDSIEEPGGAEDSWYGRMAQPGLAANMPVVRIDELAAVRGVNPTVLAAMTRFVTALPDATPLNVNTAPAEVLVARVPDLTLIDAKRLVASRDRAYFKDLGDALQRLREAVPTATDSGLAVATRYFTGDGTVTYGRARVAARALVKRDAGRLEVLWVKEAT